MAGQESHRALISNITNSDPCSVTTTEDHGYSSLSFVRLTDLNSAIPVLRGMDQLNNRKFRITVTTSSSFTLQDPITFENIDSTTFPPYVEGGRCNLVEDDFIYEGDS